MDFCNRIIRLTPANCEQDHLHLLIDNNPKAPDRNLAIAGKGISPLGAFVQSARYLQNGGADFLVMPCNTAHAFAQQVAVAVSIPMISIIDEVVSTLTEGIRVGILAADGCLAAGLYQQKLECAGLDFVCLDQYAQTEFMNLIYQIKRQGVNSAVRRTMQRFAQELIDNSADVVIAGCTEVPLSLGQSELSVPLIDSTEILASQAVAYAKNQAPLPVVDLNPRPIIVNANR
jgi:aspartate racemase